MKNVLLEWNKEAGKNHRRTTSTMGNIFKPPISSYLFLFWGGADNAFFFVCVVFSQRKTDKTTQKNTTTQKQVKRSPKKMGKENTQLKTFPFSFGVLFCFLFCFFWTVSFLFQHLEQFGSHKAKLGLRGVSTVSHRNVKRFWSLVASFPNPFAGVYF